MTLAKRFPRLKLAIVEKEAVPAAHQSGHNSGVIHSGIYYKPGSQKAQNCVAGVKALLAFAQEHGIPYELCGKVIVATSEEELPALEELHRRGTANGVPDLEMISPERLKEIEPHAAGMRALYSPRTGIIDYQLVTEAYAAQFKELGGEMHMSTQVTGIARRNEGVVLETTASELAARHIINCAGLYSDSIAQMAGVRPEARIVPFRGEYYMLTPEAAGLVNGLIYPVPDPRFPFLGVHFTRSIGGGVEAGPNAVLATAREGYTKTELNARELASTLGYGGFWRMAGRYWRTGVGEISRSLRKDAFARALQRLLPEIRAEHLTAGGSGVRAQAVAPNGALVDDFSILASREGVHVLNAPSPGATSSLAIAAHVVDLAQDAFALAG